MDKVVLMNSWGGLGDCLQFSSLPEEFYKQKGIPFYLSHKSAPCRNIDIFDLVWKNNPYFMGYSTDEPNAGHILKWPENRNDIIFDWESIHGLKPINHYAKVYADFPKLNETELLIDLTIFSVYDSYFPNRNNVLLKVMELIETYGIKEYYMTEYNSNIKLENKNIRHLIDVPNAKKIQVNNLMENARTIASTGHYICLLSGNAILASTIRNKEKIGMDVIILKEENKLPQHKGEWGWCFGNSNYIKI